MSSAFEMTKDQVAAAFEKMAPPTFDPEQIPRRFLNCSYGSDPLQAVDIYLPDEGDAFPVLVFLHGGSWAAGDRADGQVAPLLWGLKHGYAIVSMGYRLVPQVRYPYNLFDVKAALRWLKSNGAKYCLDPCRLAISGCSAGAHLAMMAGFTQNQAVFEDASLGCSCDIKAVVDLYGPTNFQKLDLHFEESGIPHFPPDAYGEPNVVDVLMGFSCAETLNMLRFVSPYDCVHRDLPPTLIQHGRLDPMVAYQQATELAGKIMDVAGREKVAFYLFENYGHADPGFFEEENVRRIFAFLDPILK